MRHKGVYPYEYMDSWKKFEETKLPPKIAFYSKLNYQHFTASCGISDQDYEDVQQVCNTI